MLELQRISQFIWEILLCKKIKINIKSTLVYNHFMLVYSQKILIMHL